MSVHGVRAALVLDGTDLEIVCTAIRALRAARRRNGVRPLSALDRIETAAQAALQRQDDEPALKVDVPFEHPLDTSELAELMGISLRRAQRLAPKLDGRRISGRWVVDRAVAQEHMEGIIT